MSYCMCEAPNKCKQKMSCYRFRKVPQEYQQPYMMLYEPSMDDPSIKCVNFVAIEGRKKGEKP